MSLRRAAGHGRLVLVAIDDLDRAKRIEEACLARGCEVRVVPHGAAALESALSDVPDVLVVTEELPLIEAPKLAEIMRANPRTQAVRLLHLGGEAPGGAASVFADVVLPAMAPPEAVAERVEGLIAQRSRLQEAETGRSGERAVEGKLAQIPLPDLLQLFHLNRRTGALELVRRDGSGREERGRLLLRDGNVVQGQVGTVEGEKALYRLLTWRQGSFAFSEIPVPGPARIQSPTRALLMEGMRQLDEWERLVGELPPLDAEITLTVKSSELPHIVHPLTQEVLLLLELYVGVQDVVDHCSYPDYQVLRTLHTLAERGIVSVRRSGSGTVRNQDSLFAAPQARRLREWLEGWGGRGRAPGDAKLLLIASAPEASARFLELAGALPGARVPGDAPARRGLGPVGRVAVDGETGIELVHVPADPVFAPLWRTAGHRALGAVLLLSRPYVESMERLEPVAAALRTLPRARLFHVVLVQDQDPSLSAALRAKLALLDDASLILVPRESVEGVARLRDLLARVVP
jgi:CheY-like chemotaxis protein